MSRSESGGGAPASGPAGGIISRALQYVLVVIDCPEDARRASIYKVGVQYYPPLPSRPILRTLQVEAERSGAEFQR